MLLPPHGLAFKVRLRNGRTRNLSCGAKLTIALSTIHEPVTIPLSSNIKDITRAHVANLCITELLERYEDTQSNLARLYPDLPECESAKLGYDALFRAYTSRQARYSVLSYMANETTPMSAMVASQGNTQRNHFLWMLMFYWLANPDSPRIVVFMKNNRLPLLWVIVPENRFC